MGRKRKTPGDRAVEELEQALAERLGVGSVANLSLDPDERRRIELYRATVDEIDVLEQMWESEKANGRLMIRGSRNQDILHPIVGEIRAQRAFLDRLLGGFRWQGSSGMSASERGQHAANARHNPSPADIMAQAQERWAKKAR